MNFNEATSPMLTSSLFEIGLVLLGGDRHRERPCAIAFETFAGPSVKPQQ